MYKLGVKETGLLKKWSEKCVFVIYCLVSDKNCRIAALLIAPVVKHFCFVIYDIVTDNNCYLQPLWYFPDADLFIANCPHIPTSFVYAKITWFGHVPEYVQSMALTYPHSST